ncbi:MAG: sugar phosphate isomerase/epimerase, partial [Anaerolineales bacterium]|nr:sugar phosphate isomerase/epimerase [Anaerolineales bacterium]
LAPLKAAGMSVLEFTLHPEGEEWGAMCALAEECVDAGYRCHFHAPYQGAFNADGFSAPRREELIARYTPPLDFAERMAERGGYAPSLVIHGAHGTGTLAQLTEDTRQFLEWVLERTRHARVMLENLPPKNGFTRLGETPEQIVALVRTINHPRLNVCWDFGHSVLQNQGLPADDFLRVVRHVHIHDINAAREDHLPLVFGNVPWQDDLRALIRVGFAGAVVMEINGYRAQSVARLPERIADSFAAMREIVMRET